MKSSQVTKQSRGELGRTLMRMCENTQHHSKLKDCSLKKKSVQYSMNNKVKRSLLLHPPLVNLNNLLNDIGIKMTHRISEILCGHFSL